MPNVTLYKIDKYRIWDGTETVQDSKLPINGMIVDAPPSLTGDQVAKRVGLEWVVLDEYPTIPEYVQPLPRIVTMRQGRIALSREGILTNVETALNAIEDAQEKEEALIEWNYSQEFNRDHALVKTLATGLSLTEEDLDRLFESASQI